MENNFKYEDGKFTHSPTGDEIQPGDICEVVNKYFQNHKVKLRRRDVYKMALKKWGESSQVVAAIEEFSELSVELAKQYNCKRPRNCPELIDELADASIMLQQMILNFGCDSKVEDRIDFKLDRLKSLLAGNVEMAKEAK